jgi:hypothetical protein
MRTPHILAPLTASPATTVGGIYTQHKYAPLTPDQIHFVAISFFEIFQISQKPYVVSVVLYFLGLSVSMSCHFVIISGPLREHLGTISLSAPFSWNARTVIRRHLESDRSRAEVDTM